jgi:hypothetical protein
MWLVLGDEADPSVDWFRDGMQRRSVAVEVVSTRALSAAVRWNHRVGRHGASVVADLPDGRRLDSNAVRATLNRVAALNPPVEYFVSPDGEYAQQELLALYLSLLHSLPGPVLNRPTPQGLSGRLRYAPEWAVLAARAGLGSRAFHVSTALAQPHAGAALSDRPVPSPTLVIVAAGRLFPDGLPRAAAAAALRLAGLAGLDLVGFRLETTAEGTAMFEAADLHPDLRPAGDPLLDHLAALADAGAPR